MIDKTNAACKRMVDEKTELYNTMKGETKILHEKIQNSTKEAELLRNQAMMLSEDLVVTSYKLLKLTVNPLAKENLLLKNRIDKHEQLIKQQKEEIEKLKVKNEKNIKPVK